MGQDFKYHEIKRPRFRRTLIAIEKKVVEERKESLKSVKHLVCQFDSKKLLIDKEKALKWVESSRAQYLNHIADNFSTIEQPEHAAKRVNEAHDGYKLIIDKFQTGNYHFSVDDSGRRFHTLLTNVKRELRNFLTYEDKELVAIDIKNSQPYFSLLLTKPAFYSCSRDKDICTLKDIYPELYNYLRKTSAWQRLRSYAAGNNGLNKRYISIESYKKDVIGGQLYDRFAELMTLSRSQAKNEMFKILFGNQAKYNTQTIAYRAFKKRYPDMAEIFSLFKSRPSGNVQKVRYQDLSIVLQRIESYMVLEVITKKFHAAYPNAPIFTIHDSVVTDHEHKEFLRQIICNELKKVVGFLPTLKDEIWTPANTVLELDAEYLEGIL